MHCQELEAGTRRNANMASKERLFLWELNIIIPVMSHCRLDSTLTDGSRQYLPEGTSHRWPVPGKAPMSKDTLYWRFETYALGQQNIPEEATALVIISKNGSQITFSWSAWKTLRRGKKGGEVPILPKFPTTNIYYFVTREIIFLKNRKH